MADGTHHPDCDGLMIHAIETARTEHGTWVPRCTLGCELGVVGSAGSKETARAMARGHERILDCDGRCAQWE